MSKLSLLGIILLLCVGAAKAQTITVQVNASEGRRPVSSYIFGRNNNISDDPVKPTTADNINLYKEAGLRFAIREGGRTVGAGVVSEIVE